MTGLQCLDMLTSSPKPDPVEQAWPMAPTAHGLVVSTVKHLAFLTMLLGLLEATLLETMKKAATAFFWEMRKAYFASP